MATAATNEGYHLVKVGVHEVYEQNKGGVRMISETAQLMQDEAIVYVLADLIGYDLLPHEAFALGATAREAYRHYKGKPPKGAKPADQRLKDAASTAKSKAKALAAKDAALLEGLQERLTDIDTVLATDRRMLARTVIALDWPARNTVIRPAPPPKPVPEPAPASLEAAAVAAEAVAQAAEQAAAIAACTAERAQKSHERLGPCPTLMYLQGWDVPRQRVGGKLVRVPISQDEREYRHAILDRWEATLELACEMKLEALRAKAEADDARADAEDAREAADAALHTEAAVAAAVAAAEAAAVAAAEAKAEEAAEEAAEAEALEVERERLQAAAAAELEACRQRIISQHGYDPCSIRLETPSETRARVHAEAAHVWGAGAVATPPKVISLVGKSPESIRTIGQSRVIDQRTTGIEERVALNRFQLREGPPPSPPPSPPPPPPPPPPAEPPAEPPAN